MRAEADNDGQKNRNTKTAEDLISRTDRYGCGWPGITENLNATHHFALSKALLPEDTARGRSGTSMSTWSLWHDRRLGCSCESSRPCTQPKLTRASTGGL